MVKNQKNTVCGISVCNPVEFDYEYLQNCIEYAVKNGYDHMQLIGPIHDRIKGNIDGMTVYEKYAEFNDEKDMDYLKHTQKVVNMACEKTKEAGIRTYVWHHELELPEKFQQSYPQVLNEYGEIEITSFEVKDFLENKIRDFFMQYPGIDGIILTLHETKVPLLKLKHQKLEKIERVKYITQILYDVCKVLGKELIPRPFASIEEDYEMMMAAYGEISDKMPVMDKWTQFDWSLCLPHNEFYKKIKKNPLMVEGDIFGEFFGKGRLPLMLKEHILEKYEYCSQFHPIGYCVRIDRAGEHPFGSVNEVNLHIMHACLKKKDVDRSIMEFFEGRYPGCGKEVKELMEPTEGILKKIIYLKDYYYSQLSMFPSLNHCKNHFYFEMMKENYEIVSDEWFIPRNWNRGSLQSVMEEKQAAVKESAKLFEKVCRLKHRIEKNEYEKLYTSFLNLKLCAVIWEKLTNVLIAYTKYFETWDESCEERLQESLKELLGLDGEGKRQLGEKFYCAIGDGAAGAGSRSFDYIPVFVEEVKKSFDAEKAAYAKMKKKDVIDFIICGGAMEGHQLKKEVNFSDTVILNEKNYRIPGAYKGMISSDIQSHGWFGYEIKVQPGCKNDVFINCTSSEIMLELKVYLNEKGIEVCKKIEEPYKDITLVLEYDAGDCEKLTIRLERISAKTPFVHTIETRISDLL